ncbi:hypothetical protein F4780DRAFT_250211, partial [Xylariomycetidae sp. FL0641]
WSNANLKRLVIFESITKPRHKPRSAGAPLAPPPSTEPAAAPVPSREQLSRAPVPVSDQRQVLSRKLALASQPLEHLAATFIADADSFFAFSSRPSEPLAWPNLQTLALTARALSPSQHPAQINATLRAAAAAALRMPRLHTLELWNGRRRAAALFRYERRGPGGAGTPPRLLWRATWPLRLAPATRAAWEAVVRAHYAGWDLQVAHEPLDPAPIRSYADAVRDLRLACQVVRPVSLRQICEEVNDK